MDVILTIGKGLLKLIWSMVKLVLLVLQAASEVSDEAQKNKTSIYGSLEAHDLYEKGEISLDEFLISTRPK